MFAGSVLGYGISPAAGPVHGFLPCCPQRGGRKASSVTALELPMRRGCGSKNVVDTKFQRG
ncbi:hypothetical protein KCP73_21455 [Salmonella enterica subsp. enterica]|nr:hypothetical protein KCP73_21455 [Salmonella enterica subsp. enterica]